MYVEVICRYSSFQLAITKTSALTRPIEEETVAIRAEEEGEQIPVLQAVVDEVDKEGEAGEVDEVEETTYRAVEEVVKEEAEVEGAQTEQTQDPSNLMPSNFRIARNSSGRAQAIPKSWTHTFVGSFPNG